MARLSRAERARLACAASAANGVALAIADAADRGRALSDADVLELVELARATVGHLMALVPGESYEELELLAVQDYWQWCHESGAESPQTAERDTFARERFIAGWLASAKCRKV